MMVDRRHAVSRCMASRVWEMLFDCFLPSGKSCADRNGCRNGFLVMDSRNQGSALKSPVCRTVPRHPWIRNLDKFQQDGHGEYLQWTYITAPGQWLASNRVTVTTSSSLKVNSVGVLRGTTRCIRRHQPRVFITGSYRTGNY